MDESVQRQISEIANNAISEINRISQLVRSTHSSSARPALPSGSESGPSSRHSQGSLLSELQRRFPTTQRSSASTSSSSTSSNRGRSQRVGRPSNESVIKDIVIVGLQCEKTLTTRQEKISLQRRNRVISGFTIEKGWNEKTLYNRVKSRLREDCKGIEFEFAKNVSGALMRPTLASGVRVNGNILPKSIASTGAVYVRLLVEDDLEEDSGIQRSLDELMSEANQETHVEITTVQNEVQSVLRQEPDKEVTSSVEQRHVAESSNDQMLENRIRHTVESTDDHGQDNGEQRASELIANDQAVVSREQYSPETVHDWGQGNGEQHVMQPGGKKEQAMDNGEQCLSEADYRRMIDNITVIIISECKGFQNPVLILKKAQEHILVGRKLEIVDPSTKLERKTNFIVVDRDKLYQDAFAEISLIDNLRLPLEVNFMGEGAQDFGGPRKEFFRLILTEIKEKLFDNGLIEDFAEDYYTSGIIMGLSVLHNGKIPTFLSEEQLDKN